MRAENFINELIVKRFSALIKNNCLAHAYLFVGADFAGKSETAIAIAKLVNCEEATKYPLEGFCNRCPSCLKITNNNHPDVQIFEATTKEECDDGLLRPSNSENDDKSKNREMRIKQIQYLRTQVQLRPFEAKRRIFILKDCENLNDEASNTLLKTLEEPSGNSLLMLTTAVPEKVLGTIISRCQRVYFAPLSVEKLEESLIKNNDADKDAAHFLAYLSEGSFGKALRLKSAKLTIRKNEIINEFVFSRDSEPFLKTLLTDKEKTKEAFDVLLTWYRDMMLMKSGVSDNKLVHSDRMKDLKKCEAKYAFAEIEEAISDIVSASKSLEENFNMKIAVTLLKEKLWRN